MKKRLENGLLVNFLNLFYGFIFQDHLSRPLDSYKNNDKILARIIATNFEAKQIHLSDLPFHINLNPYKPEVALSTQFTNPLVQSVLYGGSYILDLKNKASKAKKSEAVALRAFLHRRNATGEDDDEEGGNDVKYDIGAIIDKPVYVQGFNYFEHYAIVTMNEEVVSSLKTYWSNIKVGDIFTGVISKIVEGGPQGIKIVVNINSFVAGVVEFTHLADIPSKASIKFIKEKKEVKVRVLDVNAEKKKLHLTMKPSLLDTNSNALMDYNEAQQGTPYYGVVSGSTEKGYVLKFFNDVRGFLPLNDIETNGLKKEDFAIGKTQKVYVKFVDPLNKKMGLTLSSQIQKSHKAREDMFGRIKDQNEKKGKVLDLGVSEGDVYEYKILRKKSATNDEYLFAKSVNGVIMEKGEYVEHIAILPKTHCSDFEAHNEKVFELYKQKDVTFQAKVLSLLPNNNVLITKKASLIKQVLPKTLNEIVLKQQYYGYVDDCIQSGVRVKLSEHVKGIVLNIKLPETIQEDFAGHFPGDKTVRVVPTKINEEDNKLYFELSKQDKSSLNAEEHHSFFLDYLNEEFSFAQDEVAKDQELWKTYRVGNYVKGTIKLIKEYGIIIKFQDKLAGLILRSNLLK